MKKIRIFFFMLLTSGLLALVSWQAHAQSDKPSLFNKLRGGSASQGKVVPYDMRKGKSAASIPSFDERQTMKKQAMENHVDQLTARLTQIAHAQTAALHGNSPPGATYTGKPANQMSSTGKQKIMVYNPGSNKDDKPARIYNTPD